MKSDNVLTKTNYIKLLKVETCLLLFSFFFLGINSGGWRFNSVWVHILKYHIWNNLLQNLRIHNLGTKTTYEWGIVLAYNLNNSIYQEFFTTIWYERSKTATACFMMFLHMQFKFLLMVVKLTQLPIDGL